MKTRMKRCTPTSGGTTTKRLMAAAVAGLLGVTACASDEDGSTADEAFSFILSSGPVIPYAEMEDTCTQRGGFMQTHAACGGSNLCRGLSYVGGEESGTLSEHSCRAMNTCRGYSCIDLPEDSGLSGEDIYETDCTGCHHSNTDDGADAYTVFFPPSLTEDQAFDRFDQSSDLRLHTIVAFGTQGLGSGEASFSNMPAYRERYSRAEIERVVEYIRSLPRVSYAYTDPGSDSQ